MTVRTSLSEIAPEVKFPVTICVLCYGPNVTLAQRFLESLYAHTDARLFTLRAGLNEVEKATRSLFDRYARQFGNIDLFVEPSNTFKSPLMRRMFYEKPLTARWTLWCDDDSYFTRSDWLQRLALKIESSPEVAMWGWLHRLWRVDETILEWIRSADWYRGRRFLKGINLEGKRAFEFRFAPGAFWAIRTEVLHTLKWPDCRLIHANEDFLLGEALRQNHWQIGNFNYGVKVNDATRRNAQAAEVSLLRF